MTTPIAPISFLDLQNEFGGGGAIALTEYYAGAGLVQNPPPSSPQQLPAWGGGTAIPTSGPISLGNFRNVNKIIYDAADAGDLGGWIVSQQRTDRRSVGYLPPGTQFHRDNRISTGEWALHTNNAPAAYAFREVTNLQAASSLLLETRFQAFIGNTNTSYEVSYNTPGRGNGNITYEWRFLNNQYPIPDLSPAQGTDRTMSGLSVMLHYHGDLATTQTGGGEDGQAGTTYSTFTYDPTAWSVRIMIRPNMSEGDRLGNRTYALGPKGDLTPANGTEPRNGTYLYNTSGQIAVYNFSRPMYEQHATMRIQMTKSGSQYIITATLTRDDGTVLVNGNAVAYDGSFAKGNVIGFVKNGVSSPTYDNRIGTGGFYIDTVRILAS